MQTQTLRCGVPHTTPNPSEDWASFGEEIKALVDKAFPDHDAAQDRLQVDHFLTQLNDPQLAFSVRQVKPNMLEEVITATLEMQLHLQLTTCTLARCRFQN